MKLLSVQSHWKRTEEDGSLGPLQHLHCEVDLPIFRTLSGQVRLLIRVVMFQFQGRLSKLQWGGEEYSAQDLTTTGDADGNIWEPDELVGDPTLGAVKTVEIPIVWDTTQLADDGLRRTIIEVRSLLDTDGNSQSVRIHFPVRILNGEGRPVKDAGGSHLRARMQAWVSFPARPTEGIRRSQSGYGTIEFAGGWPPLSAVVREPTRIGPIKLEGVKDAVGKNTTAVVAVDTNLHLGEIGHVLFGDTKRSGMFPTIPFDPSLFGQGAHTIFFRASGQALNGQELATVVVMPFTVGTKAGPPPPPPSPRWSVTIEGQEVLPAGTEAEVLAVVAGALRQGATAVVVSAVSP